MKKRKIFKNKDLEIIKNKSNNKSGYKGGKGSVKDDVPYVTDENEYFTNPKFDSKYVPLEILKTINEHSIELGYNRTIHLKPLADAMKESMLKDDNVVTWEGGLTNVALTPIMVHRHKEGNECEPHIRCFITSNIDETPILDIHLDDFDVLPSIAEVIYEYLPEEEKVQFDNRSVA